MGDNPLQGNLDSRVKIPGVKLDLNDLLWILLLVLAMTGIGSWMHRSSSTDKGAVMLVVVFALALTNLYHGILSKRINALKEFIERSH